MNASRPKFVEPSMSNEYTNSSVACNFTRFRLQI
nr:MAG TPA: hypothetical protein [Caudoviricetes sp.]